MPSSSYFPTRASAVTVLRIRRRLDFVALEKITDFIWIRILTDPSLNKEQFTKIFRINYELFIRGKPPASLASSR